MPFDTTDEMFVPYAQRPPRGPSLEPQTPKNRKNGKRRHSPAIVPPEEDARRLLQECKIGKGNARVLSEALTFAKPEDLTKEIVKVTTSASQVGIQIDLRCF
jgi:hypothetical protein